MLPVEVLVHAVMAELSISIQVPYNLAESVCQKQIFCEIFPSLIDKKSHHLARLVTLDGNRRKREVGGLCQDEIISLKND